MPDGARRLHGDRQQPGVITEVLGPHRDDFDVVFDNTAYHVERPRADGGAVRRPGAALRVHQLRRPSTAAPSCSPCWRRSARHDPHDTAPVKAYGVGKVQCEQYLDRLFQEHGFPYTVFRVAHTIGPRSPLPTREPIYFERLDPGPADPRSRARASRSSTSSTSPTWRR